MGSKRIELKLYAGFGDPVRTWHQIRAKILRDARVKTKPPPTLRSSNLYELTHIRSRAKVHTIQKKGAILPTIPSRIVVVDVQALRTSTLSALFWTSVNCNVRDNWVPYFGYRINAMCGTTEYLILDIG